MSSLNAMMVILAVEDEVNRAISLYPQMNSAHEGYAVLLEEVKELWDEIKKSPKRRDYAAMRDEAIQVAAMAIRLIVDCVDSEITK